ncbi:condensation domain-containing protein [Peterkaempfera bronchialis]|uniref:condensation domain-containing protein n=1 Tax=Peterkaempfera bronchialis TaxID=2126346 RepID=UPI003C2C4DA6
MNRHPVGSARFCGSRRDGSAPTALSAPLTWGQRAIWRPLTWYGENAHYFNIRRVVAVPTGRTAEQVEAALGALLSRHEALRTLFRETGQGPVQEVLPEGTLPVPRHEAGPDGADAVADRLLGELGGRAFRHAEELPVRCALVLEQGRPTCVVLVFSHLGADYSGSQEALRDLRELLAGRAGPAPAWQPVDQARFEAEGVGAARGAAALEYWRRTLRRVPPAMFPVPPEDDRPDRFVKLRLDSPAAAVATTLLADRCQVSTGTVLLAATAAVLGAYTGHGTAVLQLIAANRHDERSRRLVAAMAQDALFAQDVARGTFDDLVRGTFLTGMNAYRFAQYDPAAMDEVLEEARTESGGRLRLVCYFNDKRMLDRWEDLPGTDGSAESLRALTEKTEVTLAGTWERQDSAFFVSTGYAPGSCLLHLLADTALIPRPEVERLLRAFETLLVDAATGTVELGSYSLRPS